MNKRLLLGSIPLAAGAAVIVACTGEALLADDGDAAASRTASATAQSESCQDAQAADPADGDDETWNGYVEGYTFPSGSTSLALTFTRHDNGTVTGHAVFGGIPFYAPPTDPNIGYPDPANTNGSDFMNLEGFRFTLLGGTLDGNRLRAKVDSTELFAQWCALQTPVPSTLEPGDGGLYSCVPNFGVFIDVPGGCYLYSDSGADVPVDCAKLALCDESVCRCTATCCTNSWGAVVLPSFDFAIAGTAADGTLLGVGGSQNDYTHIHLMQQ